MKLEQQITSLEISSRLKELGVKQESYFWWRSDGGNLWHPTDVEYEKSMGCFSAFTVAELGEMLPFDFETHKCVGQPKQWECCNSSLEWHCDPEKNIYREAMHALTEADARGKMLIYLLENKLITL